MTVPDMDYTDGSNGSDSGNPDGGSGDGNPLG